MNLDDREKQWLLNEKHNGMDSTEYQEDLVLLDANCPVDYLIGYREFLGCHIDLSNRPLIPRNETEFWVKSVIDLPRTYPISALDMCAGSGCIGIAALKHLPDTHVDFAELNPRFTEQIQHNLNINNIDPSRYSIYQSDLFTDVPHTKYDLILANPPYIAPERENTVQESVHVHEDHNSLYSQDDGLEHVKRIIDVLPDYLSEQGTCYIEFDPWQVPLLDEYLAKQTLLNHTYMNDQFDKPRVLIIKFA